MSGVTENLSTSLYETQTEDADDQNLIYSNDKLIKGLYIGIGSVGVVSNVFVLLVYLCSKKLRDFRKLTNLYMFNQTVLDLAAAIFLVASTLWEKRDAHFLDGFGGEIYCRFWLSKLPIWSMFVSSTCNLIVLNIERFLGILHPIWHKLNYTNNVAKATLAGIWLIGLVYNIGYIVPTSFVQDGECYFLVAWHPTAQRFVAILTVILQFFLPISIHCFVGIRIVSFLHRRANSVAGLGQNQNAHPSASAEPVGSVTVQLGEKSQGNAGSSNTQHNPTTSIGDRKLEKARYARNQVLKTLATMTGCFLLCWIWNQVYFLLFNLGFSLSFTGSFYHFTVVAVFVNCFTNPFIYIINYKIFRDEARQLLCKCWLIPQQENTFTEGTLTKQ